MSGGGISHYYPAVGAHTSGPCGICCSTRFMRTLHGGWCFDVGKLRLKRKSKKTQQNTWIDITFNCENLPFAQSLPARVFLIHAVHSNLMNLFSPVRQLLSTKTQLRDWTSTQNKHTVPKGVFFFDFLIPPRLLRQLRGSEHWNSQRGGNNLGYVNRGSVWWVKRLN